MKTYYKVKKKKRKKTYHIDFYKITEYPPPSPPARLANLHWQCILP